MAAEHGKDIGGPSDTLPPSYPYNPNTQMPSSGPPPYSAYPHPVPTTDQPQGRAYYPPTVTISSPGAIIVQAVGPGPSRTICRSCNQEVVTRVQSSASMRTHLAAAMLCLLGCWPCVFLPYCMEPCLNTDHFCTNCGAYVGSYLR